MLLDFFNMSVYLQPVLRIQFTSNFPNTDSEVEVSQPSSHIQCVLLVFLFFLWCFLSSRAAQSDVELHPVGEVSECMRLKLRWTQKAVNSLSATSSFVAPNSYQFHSHFHLPYKSLRGFVCVYFCCDYRCVFELLPIDLLPNHFNQRKQPLNQELPDHRATSHARSKFT